jgi:hypothetical protein
LSVTYGQRNTVARVEAVIDTADCAACSGDVVLLVAIRDSQGEPKTLEFDETWQRTDNRPVKFTKDYPIGENVDLIRVHSGRLRCSCTNTNTQ